MNNLDTARLQLASPYTIVQEGDEYLFRTDNDILYAVSFQDYDAIPGLTAYWFDRYTIRTARLTEEGIDTYLALIIQRTHPQYQEVIDLFDREIAQFQSNK